MTSLKGDLRSIMGTPFGGVGHAVLIFSRVTRAAFDSDSVILQLHDRIDMPEEAGGKFRVDGLDPGPIRIELEGGTVHNHGWNIDLPDDGTWSLTDLVDAQVDWSPAVIGRAEAAAREARDHADRAEAGADRVGTAEQVGTWASEASASASAAASARSAAQTARNASQSARDAAEGHANRAATSESNAKTSETNAKQSEGNAGDYAAVATTAATEAVDAMDAAAQSAAAFSIYTGTGSPEGKVTAPVGAVYTDSAATSGAIRWIKTSGAGTTGWKVEYGDTGTRVHNDLADGFDFTKASHHRMTIRRVGNQVFLEATGVRSIRTVWLTNNIPGEFRPRVGEYNALRGTVLNKGQIAAVGNSKTLNRLSISADTPEVGDVVTLSATWFTDDAWPSSLPGTPA